jgi:hypothetical protein
MDTPLPIWVSLANRFLVVTYCIWFLVAAWSVTRKQSQTSEVHERFLVASSEFWDGL